MAGGEVSDSLGIANAFNSLFTSAGSGLAKKFTNQTHPTHIQTTCFQHFKFRTITASEVCKLLSGLNTSKAHGTDGIMARSLKVAARQLSFPLVTIFNFLLMAGTIPGEWKQAVVTPVFKGRDNQNASNYRPISVLALCMKVFDQLYAKISKHNLLNQFQSGFRPQYSTATALLDVSDYLCDQRQHGKLTGAIFLDLKKAFDTVDPEILLQKLFVIDIQETESCWFKDYLDNRTQQVIN